MRALGAVIICAVIFIYGMCASAKFKSRTKSLECAKELMGFIKNEIRYSSREYDDIIAGAKSSKRFERLTFLKSSENIKNARCFAEKMNIAIEKDSGSCLKPSDKQALAEFFCFAGTSDKEGQINNCLLCEQKLESNLFRAKSDEQKNEKLYRILFASLSAAVFILTV